MFQGLGLRKHTQKRETERELSPQIRAMMALAGLFWTLAGLFSTLVGAQSSLTCVVCGCVLAWQAFEQARRGQNRDPDQVLRNPLLNLLFPIRSLSGRCSTFERSGHWCQTWDRSRPAGSYHSTMQVPHQGWMANEKEREGK